MNLLSAQDPVQAGSRKTSACDGPSAIELRLDERELCIESVDIGCDPRGVAIVHHSACFGRTPYGVIGSGYRRQRRLQIQSLLPNLRFEHRIEFAESLFHRLTVGDGLGHFGSHDVFHSGTRGKFLGFGRA